MIKVTSDMLSNIAGEFQKFWDKELTPQVRKELYETITKHTQSGLFTRKDVNNEVRLWFGDYADYNMAPDIVISVDQNKKIFVMNDCFWRTISGIHEREQEMRQERYKWER